VSALADGYVVTSGLIKGDSYSFLIESKTALFVVAPSNDKQLGMPIFFLGISLAAAAGLWLDGQIFALIFPLLFVAALSGVSLFRSLRRPGEIEWKLYLGSGENPILIFSSPDAEAFEAKRNEIEQALLTRPHE